MPKKDTFLVENGIFLTKNVRKREGFKARKDKLNTELLGQPHQNLINFIGIVNLK